MRDDIKYIIAGEDDEEGTRFACLATVRYAMAAAVTMLAFAVVALVVHAMLRSEDVRLSVNNGYIGADKLWRSIPVMQTAGSVIQGPEIVGASKLISRRAASRAPEDSVFSSGSSASSIQQTNIGLSSSSSGGLARECSLGCGGPKRAATTEVTLQKAAATNLRVILVASNPGGRTKIECNGTTVSLFDMQEPQGMIGTVAFGDFTVPPQTTITVQRRLKNANATYIWLYYGGEVRFSVRVQVEANVTSFPLGKPQTRPLNYTCKPVTVGLIDDESIFATGQVDCGALL